METTRTKLMRVSRRRPCPICGKHHWCSVAADGSFAICMREQRGAVRRTRNGGWLHRFGDSIDRGALRSPPAPDPPAQRPDFSWLAERLERAADHEKLAGWLGVTAAALRALGTGWHDAWRAYAWPMYDPRMRVVGIRYRASRGEPRKWAERGSQSGLFIPRVPMREPLVVCEGPTDCAAALTAGLSAIGRPSNRGALAWTVEFVLRAGIGRVVLVPDCDVRGTAGAYHTVEGARELAAALRGRGVTVRDLRRVLPAGCDLRDSLRGGHISRILAWADAS